MKKTLSLLLVFLLLALTALSLQSCDLSDNGIETYGNASMYNSGMLGDITWLQLDEELYCYVGVLEGDPELSAGVAGFTDGEYSYEVFQLTDYPGLLAVHMVSIVNLVNSYALYAGAKAASIPGKLMFDFPHKDDWLSGGQVTEMNGVSYCIYGSTQKDFTVGDLLFTYEGRNFYSVPNHSDWVAEQNKTDKNIYDLYYDTDKVTSLPVDLLFETCDFIED